MNNLKDFIAHTVALLLCVNGYAHFHRCYFRWYYEFRYPSN